MSSINGLMTFYGAGDMHGDPDERAKFCLSMGSSSAAVLIQSVEGTKQHVLTVQAHCSALRIVDVTPWLFSFMTSDVIDEALDQAEACAHATNAWKIVIDLEPYHAHDWTEAQIRQIVDGARARGFKEVAITLFTRQRWDHIDWDVAAPDCDVLLQVYLRAGDAHELASAIHRWPTTRRVILLFGTYLGDVARLGHDLVNVLPWALKVGAAGCWKLGSTSKPEAKVVKDWIVGAWPPPA